jgi:hypothetical protein
MLLHRLIPASPRRRRRLAWTAGSLAAVAAVAVAVVLMPRGEKVPQTAVRTEAMNTTAVRAPFRLTPARRQEADALVRRFAIQAAARHDPAAAWNDASSAMHLGVSHKDWDAGNLPGVVPFDADALHGLSWRVVYRAPDRIGLDVLLVARPGAKQRTTVYSVDLVLEHKRLVVDAWVPHETLGGGTPATTSHGNTSTTAVERPFSKGQLDARWLLVPTGVLALAVLVPLGLVVRNAVRNRRAYRTYARARRD